VGRKFHANGRVKASPGNTVITFVTPDMPQFPELVWAQTELAAACGSAITLLPESSLHMTVFELLIVTNRTPEKWSRNLALDAPLVETDAYFRAVVPPIPAPANLAMVFERVGPMTQAIGVTLKPADDAVAHALRAYRDALSEATGIRSPDHAAYRFHISLAYRIRVGDAHDRALASALDRITARLSRTFGVFAPAAPQPVFFEDMFAFRSASRAGPAGRLGRG